MWSTLAALTVALLATPAELEQAKALYSAGGDAFRTGKYAMAIDAFEGARALAERPVVVFSLAQAYRLHYVSSRDLSDLEAAVRCYQEYLALEPEGKRSVHATQHLSMLVPYLENLRIEGADGRPQGDARARLIVSSSVDEAEAQVDDGPPQPTPATFEVEPGPHVVRVSAARHEPITQETVALAGSVLAVVLDPPPRPASVAVEAPAGARVLIDDVPVGQSPLPAPLRLPPGDYELSVLATGRQPRSQRLALLPEEAITVEVELDRTGQRMISGVLLGAAGALAISAGVTGLYALDAQSDAEALQGRVGQGLSSAEYDRYEALRGDRDAYADATLALGISATAALVTGLVLYFFDDPAPPRMRPSATANGVAWGW